MHFAHGDKGGVPRLEHTLFFPNPLFCLTAEDVNQFLPGWVMVKWMAFSRFHVRANHEKMFVVDDVFPTKPLIECPWGGDIHFLRGGNKMPFVDFLIQRGISVLIFVYVTPTSFQAILSNEPETRLNPELLFCSKRIANDSALGIVPIHAIEYLTFEA